MLLSKVNLLSINSKCQDEECILTPSGENTNCKLPIDSVQEWKIVDYVNGAIVSIADGGNYVKFAQSKLIEKDEKIAKL